MPNQVTTIHLGAGKSISLRYYIGQGATLVSEGLKASGPPEVCEHNIDGLEALVLAQYSAGIDVTTPQYKEALLGALDAISNAS